MAFLKTQSDRDRADRIFADLQRMHVHHYEPKRMSFLDKFMWAVLAGIIIGALGMFAFIVFFPTWVV